MNPQIHIVEDSNISPAHRKKGHCPFYCLHPVPCPHPRVYPIPYLEWLAIYFLCPAFFLYIKLSVSWLFRLAYFLLNVLYTAFYIRIYRLIDQEIFYSFSNYCFNHHPIIGICRQLLPSQTILRWTPLCTYTSIILFQTYLYPAYS